MGHQSWGSVTPRNPRRGREQRVGVSRACDEELRAGGRLPNSWTSRNPWKSQEVVRSRGNLQAEDDKSGATGMGNSSLAQKQAVYCGRLRWSGSVDEGFLHVPMVVLNERESQCLFTIFIDGSP